MLGNSSSLRRLAPLLAVGLLAACGDDDKPADTPDAADTGSDTAVDAADTSDAGGDVAEDARPDGSDVGGDTIGDAGEDADTGGDVPVETGPDVGDDTDVDTTPETFVVTGTLEGLQRPAWFTLTAGDTTETVSSYDRAFAFDAPLADGNDYAVAVAGHIRDRFCSPGEVSGTIDGADAAVAFDCTQRGVAFQRASDSIYSDYYERSEYEFIEDDLLEIRWLESAGAGADGEPFTDDDDDVSGGYSQVRPDGQLLISFASTGPGEDGEWHTDDDVHQRATRVVYGDDGEFIGNYRSNGPGTDGVWLTEDDIFQASSEYYDRVEIEEGVDCVIRARVGDDGVQGTDDDPIQQVLMHYAFELPARGYSGTARQIVTDPGDDDEYCTADDLIADGRDYYLDSDDGFRTIRGGGGRYQERFSDPVTGREERFINWLMGGAEVGEDEADDTIENYWEYPEEPVRADRVSVRYDGPGPDGTWFTDDDLLARSSEQERWDLYDRQTWRATYDEGDTDRRGPDYTFGTADDVANSWQTWTYNEDGSFCRVYRDAPGADGLWDDFGCGDGYVDDEVRWVERHVADDEGRIVEWAQYSAAGDDGLWGTDDDVIDCSGEQACGWRQYLADGLYLEAWTTGSGDDGVWYTDDDDIERVRALRGEDRAYSFEARLNSLDEDDVDQYTTTERDAAGNQNGERVEYRGPGDDGEWFTDDDEVYEREHFLWIPYHPALDPDR